MRTKDGAPISYYTGVSKWAKIEFGFFRVHGRGRWMRQEYRYFFVIGDWFTIEANPRFYSIEMEGEWPLIKNTTPTNPWPK